MVKNRQTNGNWNNSNVRKEEGWSEIIDRLLEKIESEKLNTTNNYKRSNENCRELEDSSFFYEETRYSLSDY